MSRRRNTRKKLSVAKAKKTSVWSVNRKRPRKAPATTPDSTISIEKTRLENEELVKEAQEVGLVAMLAIDAPVAHRIAFKVLGIYPYVNMKGNQTRLEASILWARQKLDRNDRHYKKQVEEGIDSARKALTIAKLAIEKRAQLQPAGAIPR